MHFVQGDILGQPKPFLISRLLCRFIQSINDIIFQLGALVVDVRKQELELEKHPFLFSNSPGRPVAQTFSLVISLVFAFSFCPEDLDP